MPKESFRANQSKVTRHLQPALLVTVTIIVVVLAIGLAVMSQGANSPIHLGGNHSRSTNPPTSSSNPIGIINVLSQGADSTGTKDSTLAIAKSIELAEEKPGSEVYFPPGRYILDHPSRAQVDFTIDRPIHVEGAGVDKTFLINELGAKNLGAKISTTIFQIVTNPTTQTGEGDGSTISKMTLDSATYDAGTSIMDYANNTTLSDLVVDAPRSTNQYNPNAFGIRVIAICNPTNRSNIIRSGNLVENVTISGNGSAGQTELDISCQRNSSVRNVTISGNGIDIFYCEHDKFSYLNLTSISGQYPTGLGTVPSYTWVVTGSRYIDMSKIDTHGSGGVIAPDVSSITQHVTITQETMYGSGNSINIGDSDDTTITNSDLEQVRLDPKVAVRGFVLSNTKFSSVFCRPSATLVGLVGISCPD